VISDGNIPSRSSTVIDNNSKGENVCDFLLVVKWF